MSINSDDVVVGASQSSTRRAEDELSGPVSKVAKLTNGETAHEVEVSATSSETRADGLVWRSVGVDARKPAEENGDVEMQEEKEKVDYMKRLPRDVLFKILEWTVEVQTQPARLKMVAEDIRRTGWPKDKDTTAGSNFAKARYGALIPLRKVCRLWYDVTTPWLFSHIDFRHCPTYSYSNHHLEQALALIPLPLIAPKPKEPAVEAAGSPSTDAVPTSSPEVALDAETSVPSPSVPLGHLVQRYTLGACDQCFTYFLQAVTAGLMPKLRDIQLQSNRHLRNSSFAALVPHIIGPNLRTFDHVFPSLTDDLHAPCESLLTLLNHAPNISRLGLTGEGVNISEAYGKRLVYILKLNSTLKHRQTDAFGVGLQHLYLGPGCSIPVAFLRGLKDCAPRLLSLHVKTGVRIISDANAPSPFDLHAFIASWGSQLTGLTLIGTEGFATRSSLDEVLKLCPNLVSLHIRSDHITFTFFKSIQDLIIKPEPESAAPSSQKLRSALEVLAIAVRLPVGETNAVAKGLISSITIFPTAFVAFANACLRIEARTRLAWPGDVGGQRDVLERAALLCKAGKEGDMPTPDTKATSKWTGVSTLVGSQEARDDGEGSDGSDDEL